MCCLACRCIFEAKVLGTQLLTDIAFRTRLLTDVAFRTQLLTDMDLGCGGRLNLQVPAGDLVSTTVELAKCLAMPARLVDHGHHTAERSLATAFLHQTTPSTPRVAIALHPGWLNSSASSTSAPSRPIVVFVVCACCSPPTHLHVHIFQDPTPDRPLFSGPDS